MSPHSVPHSGAVQPPDMFPHGVVLQMTLQRRQSGLDRIVAVGDAFKLGSEWGRAVVVPAGSWAGPFGTFVVRFVRG
eukprot:8908060-Alexandrium_andersonii.AAC.1